MEQIGVMFMSSPPRSGPPRAEPGCFIAATVMLPDVAAACAVVADAWRLP